MISEQIAIDILSNGEIIALQESPCIRRKYCAQILLDGVKPQWRGVNARFSDCCDGACIRDTTHTRHGQMVERGAEIHAEQMAIVNFKIRTKPGEAMFFLSGVDYDGTPLTSTNVFPCHNCALVVKAAGFQQVVMWDDARHPIAVSIDTIIKMREAEWIST